MQFLGGVLSIILIDLILAGDNAVVIAMAVRRLPKAHRLKGILFGAGAAVILRVILTFFVSRLLLITFIKLIGGALIIWIALKLFMNNDSEPGRVAKAGSMAQAIRLIVVADLTMSTDNILAVAGASQGNLFLLIFGLIVSIPFVVFTSKLLSTLMDKYPVIILIGAAILGRVGGEMMITDPYVVGLINPGKILGYAVQVFFAVGVIIAGKLLMKRKKCSHR
jgi:YjbE family integral membrane protein